MRARSIVAAVVVLAMMGGCSTYAGSKTAAKVGGVTMLSGVVVGVAAISSFYVTGDGTDAGVGRRADRAAMIGMVAGGIFFAGLVVAVIGLNGMAFHDKPREPSQAVPLPHAGAKPESVELHERALGAALRGDCTTVLLIGERLQQIDREYYEADFVIAPAIKACVPVTQPVPPPVTPPTEAQPAPQVTPPGPTP